MHTSKLTQLFFSFGSLLSLATCVTVRKAQVQISNNTPHSISGVGLNHMYSDVYFETKTWKSIPAYGYSDFLTVTYHTGFGTTGRDWWAISGHNDLDPIGPNSMSQWYSDPNNFQGLLDFLENVTPTIIGTALKAAEISQPEFAPVALVADLVSQAVCSALLNTAKTDGYKQHILEEEDDGQIVLIQVNNDGTINIKSPSGQSDTVYHTRTQMLGL